MIISKLFSCVVELIYPRRCVVCDRPAGYNKMICPGCVGRLKVIEGKLCYKCGRKLGKEEYEYCNQCKKIKHKYKSGRSLFEYQSINQSIYRFKYKGRCEYADYYGKAMAHFLGKTILSWEPEAIIAVPLHIKKQRKRGFNQSELIAKVLSKELGIPYLKDYIVRQRNTTPMKELNTAERQINLKNAFIVGRNDVKLKTIVIVDDIYTSGSTIDEISDVLLKNGTLNIHFVTLATGNSV